MAVSEQYIKELAEERKGVWAQFCTEVEADIAARNNRDFTLNDVPENYRSSTDIPKIARIPDTAQRLVAICTDDEPSISVRPPSQTQEALKNTSLREKWLGGSIEAMNREAGRDVWRMAMDSALTKRLGVIKITLNKHRWANEPKGDDYQDNADGYLKALEDYRKGAPFPINWEDIDPLIYKPDHVGGRPHEVLEIAKRPILPTLKALGVRGTGGKKQYRKLRLGEKFPADGGLASGYSKTVEVIEYWNDDVVCYLIDGVKVDEIEHGYGRPPYFAFGSYTTPSHVPEEAYNSVVGLMRDQVKSLKRFLAIKSNWAYLAGWPFFREDPDVQGGPSPDDKDDFSQIEPGSILRGITFMDAPKVGDDLNQMIQIWQAESDRSGLAAVMFGQGAGTTSGYQVASLQAAAQSVLKPVIRNGGRALSEVLSFEQELVDKHMFRAASGKKVSGKASKVYVWTGGGDEKSGSYLGLGPDDIDGYYPVEATLRPLLPLDEIAQRDSAIRMVESGLWGPAHALEKIGENQPDEVLDESFAYKYAEESGLNARIGEDAARKAGLLPPAPPVSPMGPSPMGGPPAGIGGQGAGPIGPMPIPLRPNNGGPPVGVPRGPGGPNQVGPMQ